MLDIPTTGLGKKFMEWSKQYGKIYSLKVGSGTMIVICDRKAVHELIDKKGSIYIYGPHGPTLLSNGPTSVVVQGRWIADAIAKIEANGIKYINPKLEAAVKWKKHVVELNDRTLFPITRSTYMGGSIPGNVYEPVCYSGGIPACAVEIRKALDNLEKGFDIVKA